MTIDINDVRERNHFAIMNTATGRHLDAALSELETLREASQSLVLRMEALGLDMDPRLRNAWQRTYEAANL